MHGSAIRCVSSVLIKVNTDFFGEKVGGSENNRLLNGVENADNVTGAVRNDHCLPEHKLRVLFATGQRRRPPRSAGTHAMSQPAAVATRLYMSRIGVLYTRSCITHQMR